MKYYGFTFKGDENARLFEQVVRENSLWEEVERHSSDTWAMAFPEEVTFEEAKADIEDFTQQYGFFPERDYEFC